jgi:glycosyltransferase involved in cell wall biosynthesis
MRPRILVVAYACEPGMGSESGVGWVWSRMVATIADAWVVTRANNREAIEAALADVPERNHLRFVYVDLPDWARLWKKGRRGARLYSMLWQARVLREARRLDSEVGFDIVWHLTISTVWLGSWMPLLRKPFVFGPVGGGVGIPWRLAPALGLRGTTYEAGRAIARVLGRYANPFARLAWRRAQLILVQNPETRDWLPARVRARVDVFPNIVLDGASVPLASAERGPRVRHDPPVALYAGRLLPLKGISLAIRALSVLPGWRLLICGSGPDETRLRHIASLSRVADRVTFLGSLPRDDVLQLMRDESDALLFPSLHEEGGWVIGEALASGLPVVFLDRGGPPVLAGEGGVPVGTVASTISALADALERSAAGGSPKGAPPMFDDAARRLADLLATKLGMNGPPAMQDETGA